ncbi:MAG: septum formation initiator family protein [Actinobacteria bacterium]|uniref:Septum formation initiator family protein n=1 Tax=Candidatus Fonsibacter lacus TaxID=2576439 RepID=A0A965GCK0_9PROT|nr:septum formation initiator family protein [Candidatus Fonsibacter lacus]
MAISVVIFIIAVTIAPPAQRYFTQRAQINAIEAELTSRKARLAEAEIELQKWRDPNYVKSQARERLHFVLPGERQYIVLGVETEESANEKKKTPVATRQFGSAPWYTKLISSIQQVASNTGTSQNE